MKEDWLREALKRHYAKLLGELQRLQKPPKYETRLISDREKFAAQEFDRLRRIDEIQIDLPPLAHVVKMFDPSWKPEDVKAIRPKEGRQGLIATSYAGAAMDVLRESDRPHTIRELVLNIADRYDLDVSTSDAYQRVHTAVNNGLKSSYKRYIKSFGGQPERFGRANLPDER